MNRQEKTEKKISPKIFETETVPTETLQDLPTISAFENVQAWLENQENIKGDFSCDETECKCVDPGDIHYACVDLC